MTANHLADLNTIIEDLDQAGMIAHVNSEVSLHHDLAGVAARLEGEPRAVLFHDVSGHDTPVIAGLYWSRDLLAHLLRQEVTQLPQYVSGCIEKWQKAPIDPVVEVSGPILQGKSGLSLSDLPIPVHAAKDGGAYFDAGVVIATDPETGVRNASIQRFMVIDDRTLHVNIDAGRHLGLYLEKAKNLGKSLFISINCGVGPGLHFAAAAPAEAAPAELDELGIASEFHGAPLQLVNGKMTPTELVANAMYAIECEMIPGEVGVEGPFAEVTGYYARAEPRPVVHVRAIHARPDPVFQTILSGAEVWNSVGLLGEANVLAMLKKQVPGVQEVYFTHGGCGFYHAVVSLSQKRAGWAKQAIMATFAAFPPLKLVTVVDDDVNIRDASDVEWAMATRLDARHGIIVIDKVFGHGLNPGFPDYLGTKTGFDCTRPCPHSYEYDRAAYKAMSLDGLDISDTRPVSVSSDSVNPDSVTHDQSQPPPASESMAVQLADSPAAKPQASPEMTVKKIVDGSVPNPLGVLVVFAGKDSKDPVRQEAAFDLFVDLESRLLDGESAAFERVRTSVEFKSTLKAYRGFVSHLILISGTKTGEVFFADQKNTSTAKHLGKLLNHGCHGKPLQVLFTGRLQKMQSFARKLSDTKAVKEVVLLDRSASSSWIAHLLGGYFMCLKTDDRTEVALRNSIPAASHASLGVWRNGKPFTRLSVT